jgi:pyruvate-formate lyase-activating enzyme
MAAANGPAWRPVTYGETIPLPEGSTIVAMPGRRAVGWDPASESFEVFARLKGMGPVCAAAAVVPPAYLRTLLPAQECTEAAPSLPLLGYTAVGWAEDGFRVAALRLDERTHWDPVHYGTPELAGLIAAKRAALPGNRIVEQLAHCALDYDCYTAQNLFYGRWEAGLPVSPTCNSDCVGCISLQPSECCPSPQQRLAFEPTLDEVAAIAIEHLSKGREPLLSFGQGCEGEPLLRADLIAEAVRRARAASPLGTVNINTNGSRPEVIADLAAAGVDSLRISLATANATRYDVYHRPRGHDLSTVAETIDRARSAGLHVSLNLLVFPGVTDTERESRALLSFLTAHPVPVVQMRNLNLDPDDALDVLNPAGAGMGIRDFLARVRATLPGVRFASFNSPVERGPNR